MCISRKPPRTSAAWSRSGAGWQTIATRSPVLLTLLLLCLLLLLVVVAVVAVVVVVVVVSSLSNYRGRRLRRRGRLGPERHGHGRRARRRVDNSDDFCAPMACPYPSCPLLLPPWLLKTLLLPYYCPPYNLIIESHWLLIGGGGYYKG